MNQATTNSQSSTIRIDIQSVRHWINYCETGNCDDAGLNNEMLRDFGVKDLAVYFQPLRFLGWHKYYQGEYTVSPLKKHFTNSYIFEIPDGTPPFSAKHDWAVGDLQKYLGLDRDTRQTSSYRSVLAKLEAELVTDDAARQYALAELSKFASDATGIAVYNMAPSKKSATQRAWKVLPDEIGNYTGLTGLTLDGQYLRELPASLGRLSRLKSLNLTNNRFKILPTVIGELTTLESLNLEWNAHLEAFPPEIGKLGHLRMIYMRSCTNFRVIPDEFSRLVQLEKIDLTYVNASGELKQRIQALLPTCEVIIHA